MEIEIILAIGNCFRRYFTCSKEERRPHHKIHNILVSLLVSLFLVGGSIISQRKTEAFPFPALNNKALVPYRGGRSYKGNCIATVSIRDIRDSEDKMMTFENLSSHEDEDEDLKRKHRSREKQDETAAAGETKKKALRAPLYITVGPQCSGKTTMLSKILGNSDTDVSIDAQKGVYYSIPLEYALNIDPRNMTETERAVKVQKCLPFAVVNQTIHGSTLQQRILHPSQYELHLVLQRLCGKISADEFRDALKNNIPPPFAIPTHDQKEELIQCVEHTIRKSHPKQTFISSEIDLFVADAIFKGGGLQSAQEQLHNLCIDETKGPIAWGNTNTRPREYEHALKVAETSGRPVYFIIYGRKGDRIQTNNKHRKDIDLSMVDTDHNMQQPLFLPVVNRIALIQRNIERFCVTGRYINVKAINDAIIRTEDLLTRADNNSAPTASSSITDNRTSISCNSGVGYSFTHTSIDTTFQLHASLAMMAGFQLCPLTRTVSSVVKIESTGRRNNNNRRSIEMNAATLSSDQKHGKTTPWGYNNSTNGRDSSSSSQMHYSATTNSGYYLGSRWQQSTKRYYREEFSNNNQIQAGKNEGSNSTVRVSGSRIQNSNGSGGGDWKRQSGHQSSHYVNDSRSKK
jgi:hypothetical protein